MKDFDLIMKKIVSVKKKDVDAYLKKGKKINQHKPKYSYEEE